MDLILRNIRDGLVNASPLDQANLVLGVLGVWLMTRRNLWAFPVGLVAVTVQGEVRRDGKDNKTVRIVARRFYPG